MFQKPVTITFFVLDNLVTTTIYLSCCPDTPDEELIRRAKNILNNSIKDAEFTVL